MINKDSIVTAYDEHLTLVEWLQKVELALKDAVLTGVTINKKGNATLSFVFTFEDGTTLETDDLILQQGESVQSATIRNGHLILTLTNGDELDAGAIFNGNVVINGSVSTPILTSANDHIEAQKPVVEVMTGYSFEKENVEQWTPLYIGACKNGNKITFTIYARVAKTSSFVGAHLRLGVFYIPAEVGNKLVPDASNNLDFRRKEFMTGATDTSPIEATLQTEKITNSNFSVQIRNFNNFTEGESRIFRYEVTFLLSDNLA